MTKNRVILISVILVLTLGIGVGVRWMDTRPGGGVDPDSNDLQNTSRSSETGDFNLAEDDTDPPVTISQASPQPKSRLSPPTSEEIRDEVENNPHRTPNVLIQFARSVAPRMKEAKNDAIKATELFNELESCVTFPGTASMQAYCLSNAKTLSQSHPMLSSRYSALENQASQDVKDLMQAASSL